MSKAVSRRSRTQVHAGCTSSGGLRQGVTQAVALRGGVTHRDMPTYKGDDGLSDAERIAYAVCNPVLPCCCSCASGLVSGDTGYKRAHRPPTSRPRVGWARTS